MGLPMIPESQLETWSHQASTQRSAETYASISKALDAIERPSFERFLQGSYANSTNIRADSDVDVVAAMTTTFRRSLERLPEIEKQRYRADHHAGTYTYSEWRGIVLRALISYYGASSVHEGNKAIRVDGSGQRLPADVLPAMQYRDFFEYRSYPGKYRDGIVFEDQRDGRQIINWPKQHIANGKEKNSDANTGRRYKRYVRIFKNARNAADTRGYLDRRRVPSYFLEGLLYNVPNSNFETQHQSGFTAILLFLLDADLDTFLCQNGVTALLGPTPEQWNESDALHAILGLGRLWKDW